MATPCTISLKTSTGFKTVYCHWNGYPSFMGDLLLNYYNTLSRVSELVSLGHISSLSRQLTPDPSKEHTFDNPQEGVTVFYGRDRNDANQETLSSTELDWVDESYNYLFTPGDGWSISNDDGPYIKLTEKVINSSE